MPRSCSAELGGGGRWSSFLKVLQTLIQISLKNTSKLHHIDSNGIHIIYEHQGTECPSNMKVVFGVFLLFFFSVQAQE